MSKPTKEPTIPECRRDILVREMVRWTKEASKNVTAVDAALSEMLEFCVKWDMCPPFLSKTDFSRESVKLITEYDPHLAEVMKQLLWVAPHWEKCTKIVWDLNASEVREMYENNLPVRPSKEQKPETIELKEPKPKKKDKKWAEAITKFHNAAQ